MRAAAEPFIVGGPQGEPAGWTGLAVLLANPKLGESGDGDGGEPGADPPTQTYATESR